MKQLATVLLVATLAHLTAIDPGAEYVYDDHAIVERNPRLEVRSLGDAGRLLASNWWGEAGERSGERLFRPVPLATFALERALLGRPSPLASRVANVAFHALAAAAALSVFRQLASRDAALAAALVFAAHPAHAEAVAGAVGRAEVLALLFGLAALALQRRARDSAAHATLSGLAFLLALGSKESAVAVLPIALARELLEGRRLRSVLPLVLALTVYVALRAWVLGGLVAGEGARTLGDMPLGRRLLVALAVARDAWLATVLPLGGTAAHFPYPAGAPEPGGPLGDPVALAAAVAIQLAVIAAVVGLAQGDERSRAIALGLVAFELALLPVLNLVPIGVVFAERLLYAPSAWAALALGAALPSRRYVLPPLVGLLALGSLHADMTWQNDVRLWEATARRFPGEARAQLALGESLLATRPPRPDRAVPHLERAAQGFPEHQAAMKAKAHGRLAQALRMTRRPGAEEAFGRALELAPRSLDVLFMVARARLEDGRNDDALLVARRAEALAPANVEAHTLAGVALRLRGELDAAIAELERALELGPGSPEAIFNRAEALWAKGERARALEDYRRAAILLPAWRDPPRAPLVLVERLAEAGRRDEALAAIGSLKGLSPDQRALLEARVR